MAGAPIGLWLRTANPELFAAIRTLEARRLHHRTCSERLADDIGRELVGATGITRAERNMALEVRRSLYNGRALDPSVAPARLAQVAASASLDASAWLERLLVAAKASQELVALDQQIEAAVRDEPARLAEAAWTACKDVPAARLLMRHKNPSVLGTLEQRATRGGPWGCKSARQSGDYVWRALRRASTKSNPRDWHGHAGLLSIHARDPVVGEPAVAQSLWVQWTENVHGRRCDLVEGPLSERPGARLAVTPLHWRTEHHLRAWTVDREDPRRLVEVELRRTALLDEIYDVLAAGSLPLDDLAATLGASEDAEARVLLGGFVEHLAGLGVVELSSPPRAWMLGPMTAIDERMAEQLDAADPADVHRKEHGFLDVYRRVSGELPLSDCLRLQRMFAQVQRLLALIDDDLHPPVDRTLPDQGPVSLLEAVRTRVLAPSSVAGHALPFEQHWPPARSEGSGYGQLLAWIERQADRSTVVDIDAQRLDALGAPSGAYSWPVDCVLRIPATRGAAAEGVVAVLDEAFAAGALDARFVGALRHVEEAVPHADDYQRFLQRLEQATGVTILELLIPPLSVGAANAIRRPLLTRAWTGDPDVGMYIDGARPQQLQYVPLGALTLRRSSGRIVVEADGRRVWPIYHATRKPLLPWSVLAKLLLTASPLCTSWYTRRLHFSLDAFGERDFMPRITVGGGLVVSGAQWRLGADPWDRSASLRAKLEGLERLRARLGLPRWVFVSGGRRRKPVACDLESMLAVRVLEDAVGHEGGAWIVEMLPHPHELLTRDDACSPEGRSVSSVMLRFPYDEPPHALADRIAARLLADG